MLIKTKNLSNLTYCLNVFQEEKWINIFKNLKNNIIPIKNNITNNAFGLSLCISYKVSKELKLKKNKYEFTKWMEKNNIYISSINGFAYQNFHSRKIKDKIYYPEWTSNLRTKYTENLIYILSLFMKKKITGSISTCPISYKYWMKNEHITYIYYKSAKNLSKLIYLLINIKKNIKKHIHIDLEPEPTCLIEHSKDLVKFFNKWLIPTACKYLKKKLNITLKQAKLTITNHIKMCYDICHIAIKFKNHKKEIDILKKNKIKIGKIQISSGLKLQLYKKNNINIILNKLIFIIQSPFLHQTTEKQKNKITTYKDFKCIIKHIKKSCKYKIHCHIPIYLNKYLCCNTTNNEIYDVINIITKENITSHIEIETYTYNILNIKKNIKASIINEYKWLLKLIKTKTGKQLDQ